MATEKHRGPSNSLNWQSPARSLRPYVPFTALNTVWRKLDRSAQTILDVGCGRGEPASFMNRKGNFRMVGIDIFGPYLEEARKRTYVLAPRSFSGTGQRDLDVGRVYDGLILGDVRHLPFQDKSFDAVICMEVLEHLDKEAGEELLNELERVARRQVLLTTPIGRYHQGPCDGNPFQRHKYVWEADKLRLAGYKTTGAGIRGIPREGTSSAAIRFLRDALYAMGGVFSYSFPKIACHIVAEKGSKAPT